VTAQWSVGAVQVTSEGQPVVIMTGLAVCAPTGTPLVPVSAQTRAVAT
jgi:allophanate hydrolase subunit 2